MTKKMFFVVTLALFALAGCGTVGLQNPLVFKERPAISSPATASATKTLSATEEPSAQKQAEVSSFPSSKNPTKGKKWTEMGAFPYKGTLDEAIARMPLDANQKGRLKAMMASGECARYEIKDGEKFAVDWLNFTSGGVHKNRVNVGADLKKLPSNMVTICNLGDGVYAGQFDGCKNLFVVFSKVQTAELPGAPALEKCPTGRTLVLHLWDRSKLPSDLQVKLDNLTAEEAARAGSFRGPAVSRGMGGELRARSGKGEFSRSAVSAKVLPSLLDGSGVKMTDLQVSSVSGGTFTWNFPNQQIEGRTISLIFPDSGIISPPSVLGKSRELRLFWEEWGDTCLMNVHAAHK